MVINGIILFSFTLTVVLQNWLPYKNLFKFYEVEIKMLVLVNAIKVTVFLVKNAAIYFLITPMVPAGSCNENCPDPK